MRGARAARACAVLGVVGAAAFACRAIVGIEDLTTGDGGSNDGGPPRVGFCAGSEHEFCADFDEDADITQGWEAESTQYGDWSRDFDVFQSPPSAAQGRVNPPAVMDGGNEAASYALFTRSFPIAPSQVHLAADIRVGPSCVGDITTTTALLRVNLGGNYGLQLMFSGPIDSAHGLNLAMSELVFSPSSFKNYLLGQGVPAGSWMHVAIDAYYGAAPSVHLAVGTTSIDHALNIAAVRFADSGAPSGVTLFAGPLTHSPTSACEIDYDNVTLDLR
jgi:hypothetical protein